MRYEISILIFVICFFAIPFSSCSPIRHVKHVLIGNDYLKIDFSRGGGEILGFFLVDTQLYNQTTKEKLLRVSAIDSPNRSLKINDSEYNIVYAFVCDRNFENILQPTEANVSITNKSIIVRKVPKFFLHSMEIKDYSCIGVFGAPNGDNDYFGQVAKPVFVTPSLDSILIIIVLGCALPLIFLIACLAFFHLRKTHSVSTKKS